MNEIVVNLFQRRSLHWFVCMALHCKLLRLISYHISADVGTGGVSALSCRRILYTCVQTIFRLSSAEHCSHSLHPFCDLSCLEQSAGGLNCRSFQFASSNLDLLRWNSCCPSHDISQTTYVLPRGKRTEEYDLGRRYPPAGEKTAGSSVRCM